MKYFRPEWHRSHPHIVYRHAQKHYWVDCPIHFPLEKRSNMSHTSFARMRKHNFAVWFGIFPPSVPGSLFCFLLGWLGLGLLGFIHSSLIGFVSLHCCIWWYANMQMHISYMWNKRVNSKRLKDKER
jgi:membrane protein YqaA with SNARE-associated domain